MKIIGIDPGYDRIGVAVVEKETTTGKETLVYSTCIETSKKDAFSDRLVDLGNKLDHIIETYRPDQAAIEILYFAKNSTTALSVAEARGVIQFLLRKNTIPISEYHPTTIKLAITGYGSADKKAILAMIPRLITLNHGSRLDDELDAIAVALTHSAHMWATYPQK